MVKRPGFTLVEVIVSITLLSVAVRIRASGALAAGCCCRARSGDRLAASLLIHGAVPGQARVSVQDAVSVVVRGTGAYRHLHQRGCRPAAARAGRDTALICRRRSANRGGGEGGGDRDRAGGAAR
jgi:prepilin-type N-terminal cleavage/methylation domain-containing protein